ncbi:MULTISPECIES: hypothetical protein [unclassified Nonomuraea]|uniref:hypothetical protein n=1 Tax=unclassified Nonomuraea TaxID=2593643 RepID=UPI003405256C
MWASAQETRDRASEAYERISRVVTNLRRVHTLWTVTSGLVRMSALVVRGALITMTTRLLTPMTSPAAAREVIVMPSWSEDPRTSARSGPSHQRHGTTLQIADKLRKNHEQLGFGHITLLEGGMDATGQVMELLR